MKLTTHLAATGLFVFHLALTQLLGGGATPGLAAGQLNSPPQTVPLGSVLAPDGTFRLPPEFSGAFDARGWRLTPGPGREPRFVRLASPDAATAKAGGDENWSPLFPGPAGVGGVVRSVAVSSTGEIYVGGEFTQVINSPGDALPAAYVAKWDGGGWSALGSGVNGTVNALTLGPQGELYVGGYFSEAGGQQALGVARWDGHQWSSLGNGIQGSAQCMVMIGTDLYVGGSFETAGTGTANSVAKWDGTAWSGLGGGVRQDTYYGQVSAMASGPQDQIYIAGQFQTAGGVKANSVAFWDGTSWSALGAGISGDYVYAQALAVDDAGNVFVGGYFWDSGSGSYDSLKKWDGRQWSSIGGLSDTVTALHADRSRLYVGGYFTSISGQPFGRVALWDGAKWQRLDTGLAGGGYTMVNAMAIGPSGELCVGGAFTVAGGVDASFVAKWNGRRWSPLGSGVGGWVYAVATDETGGLYLGGEFTTVGGLKANNIVHWDGTAWSVLGTQTQNGVDGLVNSILARGGKVFVGGEFTSAGGTPANRVASWDGAKWAALGEGANDTVYALAALGNDLVAAGAFTQAGSEPAAAVARWDGARWRALGAATHLTEPGAFIRALAAHDTDLYVGGSFGSLGGVSARAVARWNGTEWSALGEGVNGVVNAMAFTNDRLYAGGLFSAAGGVAASHIAYWDGTTWSTLGSGLNSPYGYVLSLAVGGQNELFVGGYFDQTGGAAARRVARWDGVRWYSLGTGLDGTYPMAYAMSTHGTDLYAGGSFDTAGDANAMRIAKWNGARWDALTPGASQQASAFVNGDVMAVALVGKEVYVGGRFTRAGSVAATNIARWDGQEWSALGKGLGGETYDSVNALALGEGYLYAGGYFSRAGSLTVQNVARWSLETRAWGALGAGVQGTVNAVAAQGGNIYVGGLFTRAGNIAANQIARWNSTNRIWYSLGSGLTGANTYDVQVSAIVVSGDGDLLVGGGFTKAGALTVNHIARWSSGAWSALGTGVAGSDPTYTYGICVNAIAIADDGTIFAAGQFAKAGGRSVTNIACWRTNKTWSGLAGGGLGSTYDTVNALAMNGTNLYAGGAFSLPAQFQRSSLARWDGQRWKALGSGISGGSSPRVLALAASGLDLYVGGSFTQAGGKLSYFFAQWNELGQFQDQPTLQTDYADGLLRLSWPATAEGFVLETRERIDASTAWTGVGVPPQVVGTSNVVQVGTTNASGFFRLTAPR